MEKRFVHLSFSLPVPETGVGAAPVSEGARTPLRVCYVASNSTRLRGCAAFERSPPGVIPSSPETTLSIRRAALSSPSHEWNCVTPCPTTSSSSYPPTLAQHKLPCWRVKLYQI